MTTRRPKSQRTKPWAPEDGRSRCAWALGDPQMVVYHDTEWGVPEHDGRALFEKLMLDGLQAGLSWRTILHRRAGLQAALDHFDPAAMARYDAARRARLMEDPRLIRSALKIKALVTNAQAYEAMPGGAAAFSALLWQFVDQTPVQHGRRADAPNPTESVASQQMSHALRARGFSFCGPVICYAFMQAVGMVNDHAISCFRRHLLAAHTAHP